MEMSELTSRRDKLKLAEEYIKYYDDLGIDDAFQNIYRFTGDGESVTGRNFFDVFVNEKGCREDQLGSLEMIITNLLASGVCQKVAYLLFVTPTTTGVTLAFEELSWTVKVACTKYTKNIALTCGTAAEM